MKIRELLKAFRDGALFALMIGALLLPACRMIYQDDETQAEKSETGAVLEEIKEVEQVTAEDIKTAENENLSLTEETAEEKTTETEEPAQPEETEPAPEVAEVVTEEYQMTATIEEAEEIDPDYAENMAQALAIQQEPAEEFTEQAETVQDAPEESSENGLIYLGQYEITAYEWTGNPCANGNYPTEGYTVACNSLPLGTVLYIDGIGYRTVEDRGAEWHSDCWIDLYLGDPDACINWGVQYLDVYIVE